MTIWLYEFTGMNPETEQIETLRICSEPYITQKDDTPANTFYDDRVADEEGSGGFERWIFGRYSTFGAPTVGAGSIRLRNEDGVLDRWRSFGFDGRPLTIKTVADRFSRYDNAETFASLTVESVEFGLDSVDFQIRDEMYVLTLPAQTATFAGTNVDTDDLEGTPDTIQGRIKPFVLGVVKRRIPTMANYQTLMYPLNHDKDGNPIAVQSIDGVYDGENPVSLDTSIGTAGDFATVALLAAATIATGHYATCLAKGVLRLEGLPTYVLTVDITEGATSADRTMAQCVKRFMEDYMGITLFLPDSAAYLDSLNSAEVGIYVDDEKSALEVNNYLLQGDMAYCLPLYNGVYYFGRLEDPASGDSVVNIGLDTTLDEQSGFKRVPLSDPGDGIPPWKTIMNYLEFEPLRDTEIAGVVSAEDREAAKKRWRSTSDEDLTVKDIYLTSPVHEVNSAFVVKADADTAVARQQSIRGVMRDLWIIPLSVEIASVIPLGLTVTLTLDRYGLEVSKKGVILGYNFPSIADGIIELGILV
jgi:hypothetical protein